MLHFCVCVINMVGAVKFGQVMFFAALDCCMDCEQYIQYNSVMTLSEVELAPWGAASEQCMLVCAPKWSMQDARDTTHPHVSKQLPTEKAGGGRDFRV